METSYFRSLEFKWSAQTFVDFTRILRTISALDGCSWQLSTLLPEIITTKLLYLNSPMLLAQSIWRLLGKA